MPRPPNAAFEDPLTGLSNREHFEILYDFAFHIADRGVAVTVLHIELDGLHTYRERNGEAAEEQALREFGTVLTSTTRITDVTARTGETRLAVLLVDCNLHGGLVCADRIRAEATAFTEETGLTVSAGLATWEKGMAEPQALLALADATLRLAIEQGGDRVAVPADLPAR